MQRDDDEHHVGEDEGVVISTSSTLPQDIEDDEEEDNLRLIPSQHHDDEDKDHPRVEVELTEHTHNLPTLDHHHHRDDDDKNDNRGSINSQHIRVDGDNDDDNDDAQLKKTSSPKRPIWPLALLAHSTFATFFCYETFGALGPQLNEELGITAMNVGALFSAYSVPAFVSLFVASVLIAKLSPQRFILIAGSFVAAGYLFVLLSLAVSKEHAFGMMFMGQLIFGIGSAPMYATMCSMVSNWWGTDLKAKSYISLAYGIIHAWLRLGSSSALYMLPYLGVSYGLLVPFLVSAFVGCSSFASSLAFYWSVQKINREEAYRSHVALSEITPSSHTSEDSTTSSSSSLTTLSVSLDNSQSHNVIMTSSFVETGANGDEDEILRFDKHQPDHDGDDGILDGDLSRFDLEPTPKVPSNSLFSRAKNGLVDYVQDFRTFPLSYWLILGIEATFIGTLYTFTAFAPQYYNEKYHYSIPAAGRIASGVCLSNMVTSWPIGYLSSRFGRRVTFIVVGAFNIFLVHLLYQFTYLNAIFLACLLGITQSVLDTTLMPSLSFIIEPKYMGKAYILCSVCWNMGLLTFPTIVGSLRSVTGGWTVPILFLMTTSAISFVLALSLKYVDWKNGTIMDVVEKPNKNNETASAH